MKVHASKDGVLDHTGRAFDLDHADEVRIEAGLATLSVTEDTHGIRITLQSLGVLVVEPQTSNSISVKVQR